LAEPIFFELEGSDVTDLTVLDGLVGAVIHFVMESGQPLHVEGRLTSSCLHHLTKYQKYWSLIRPGRCSAVKITADEIVADQGDNRDLPAVAAFSGGVDSTFSILRHAKRLVGIDTIPLDAVLIVHGIGSRSSDNIGFSRLLDRLQPAIDEFGLRRYVVRTNIKEVAIQDWLDSYMAQLVGCLHLVSHRHSKAMIAGDGYAHNPVFDLGGNPISVPLLSSGRLRVFYEGPEYGRTAKVALLAKYPSITRCLKFCWQGPEVHKNCGQCIKCFMTYMNFRAVGVEEPNCFDIPVDASKVGNYTIIDDGALALRYDILQQLWKIPELAELTARFSAPIHRYEEEKLRAAADLDSPVIPAAGHTETAHGQSTKRTWEKFFRLKS
jgi:hypothetical protein